ncbi:MAG TPA: aromatic amino acid hydroxylase [Polyangiales bacterium]|nr:aromatic amino acid hydroxylase [Polyangiales bacterium]
MDTSVPVPAHLRRYVVEQNYAAYTSRDQAVWRFVLLQTHARLLQRAHPAYAAGFAAAGIEVDRIPHIARMSEQLAATSFRTVCVDGFIPPRAFQAFQARGLLPIAADIRSAEHLAYTPAPDIIHEAAGHAPFLANADYARFLRRIGALSERAFENAQDRRLYDAIHLLSELKEDPASTPAQVQRAEAQLASVKAESSELSEATRMARLYWWTVEYGLIGTLTDFRLYGAGLLSSIGEAHFCQRPNVQKRWLDASCVEQDYDITRSQPQLFVARSFGDLERVLDEVARGASRGAAALEQARRSEDVATLELPGGLAITGGVHDFSREHVALRGPCRISRDGRVLDGLPETDGYLLPLGIELDALRRDGRVRVAGLELSGTLVRQQDGVAWLRDVEVTHAGAPVLRASSYPLLLAEHVVTASAAVPDGFYPATPFAGTRVPKPRSYADAERHLLALHEQVTELMQARLGAEAVRPLHRALDLYPHEWLLRWNLLEALVVAGQSRHALARTLGEELEQLELRYAHREPIATGLAQLRALTS